MNKRYMDYFTVNTEAGKFFSQVENLSKNTLKREYEDIIESNKVVKGLFLSVIIRTQGKRLDGLRESLLCLKAQTCQDFEIIVIGHKITDPGEKNVLDIINDQDESFISRIRYYRVDHGKRGTPLNYGFAYAKGEYVAIYDDDDVLFDGWVEAFKQASVSNYGRVLHLYGYSQLWQNEKNSGYVSIQAPKPQFCIDFNFISQLHRNECPLFSLAFPSTVFKDMKFMFDEELNVIEDWDFLMRIAVYCGVSDIRKAEAIYRLWKNLETSSTLHSQKEWKSAYEYVQKKFANMMTVFNIDSIRHIGNYKAVGEISEQDNSNSLVCRLYYSDGQKFDIKKSKTVRSVYPLPSIDLLYSFDSNNSIKGFKLNISEDSLFLLRDLVIEITLIDNQKVIIPIDQCVHNGILYNKKILYIYRNPSLIWEWDEKKSVSAIHITGYLARALYEKRIIDVITFLNNFKTRRIRNRLKEKGLL